MTPESIWTARPMEARTSQCTPGDPWLTSSRACGNNTSWHMPWCTRPVWELIRNSVTLGQKAPDARQLEVLIASTIYGFFYHLYHIVPSTDSTVFILEWYICGPTSQKRIVYFISFLSSFAYINWEQAWISNPVFCFLERIYVFWKGLIARWSFPTYSPIGWWDPPGLEQTDSSRILTWFRTRSLESAVLDRYAKYWFIFQLVSSTFVNTNSEVI